MKIRQTEINDPTNPISRAIAVNQDFQLDLSWVIGAARRLASRMRRTDLKYRSVQKTTPEIQAVAIEIARMPERSTRTDIIVNHIKSG